MKTITALFERFAISMPQDLAEECSAPGACDEAVTYALQVPEIAAQLSALSPDDIRAELREYGAWDDGALANNEENHARLIWIAACNLRDEAFRG